MTERVIYVEHPRMFRNSPVRFAFDAVTIPFGIGLIDFVSWWIRCLSSTLTITESKTSLRSGILSRGLNEISNSNVRNIVVKQSFFQRIMNVGYVGISTSGQCGIEIEIDGIHDPLRVKKIIEGSKSECTKRATPPDWLAAVVLAIGVLVGTGLLLSVLTMIRTTSTSVVERVKQSTLESTNLSSSSTTKSVGSVAAEQRNNSKSTEDSTQRVEQRDVETTTLESHNNKQSIQAPSKQSFTNQNFPIDSANSEPVYSGNDVKQTSKSVYPIDDDEKRAANKLKLVQPFLTRGNRASAIKRLEEIIKDYPNTKSAEEATKMLLKLK